MRRKKSNVALRFCLSRRATAIPVSFLLLFVSLTIIVSATYYVSVMKIQAKGQLLNVALAKRNMLAFENSIGMAKWSVGTSAVCHFEDSGGTFKIYPTAKSLLIEITDNSTFYTAVFNSSVGQVAYELPSAAIAVYTFYMKGDKRAIINQSAFTSAQLCLSAGAFSPEITLTYRPMAAIGETGFQQGRPVNTLRIYIINLNTSKKVVSQGEFNVKATCTEVFSKFQTYNVTHAVSSIFVKGVSGERTDIIALPVSSNEEGAFLKVETLVCQIKLERIEGGG